MPDSDEAGQMPECALRTLAFLRASILARKARVSPARRLSVRILWNESVISSWSQGMTCGIVIIRVVY